MVEKNRRRAGGRVTDAGTGRVTPKGSAKPTSRHSPLVRIITLLAVIMMVLTLAVGIIAAIFG